MTIYPKILKEILCITVKIVFHLVVVHYKFYIFNATKNKYYERVISNYVSTL